MIKLIIVRHGESVGNLENIIQGGKIDFELTEKGKQEAEKLALALKDEKIDVIYSSPLKRALETAEIINKYHNLKINMDSKLSERSYGIMSGIRKADLTPEQREIFNKRYIEDFKLPGGESILEQRKRVKKSIEYIIKNNENKTILIVVHGGTKRAILRDFAGLSHKDILVKIPNASITEVEIKGGHSKILKLFSKEHL